MLQEEKQSFHPQYREDTSAAEEERKESRSIYYFSQAVKSFQASFHAAEKV